MDTPGSTSTTGHRIYSFGECTLDVDRGALFCAGREARLRPKSIKVLTFLVEHHGRLVTKDELLTAVWGNIVVADDSLTQCLTEIRKEIGDASRRMIRTVPRRGYLFDLPVDTQPVPAPDARAVADSGWARLGRLTAAVAVVLLGIGAVWWFAINRAQAPALPASPPALGPVSVAVLPFIDMSQAQDQEYLGDGIAEEILNLLAQNPELKVIARTSSFSFKHGSADVPTIAAKLGVAHVLEGSVRKSDNRVRVTAQLVDARTSAHLWSQTYDRELGDVLRLQTDIAGAVAAALKARLTPGDEPVAKPVDPQAYTHFLQGRFFFNRRGPGDVERARDHFQQAVDVDPEFARAWAGLAGACFILLTSRELPFEAAGDSLRNAVERALALEPDLTEAHIRAAQYHYLFGDRETARVHARMISTLNSDDPLALAYEAGNEATYGRIDEAIELQRRAVDLDPLGVASRINLASFLLSALRFDDAREEFIRADELDQSDTLGIDQSLTLILILEQRYEQALAAVRDWPAGPERDEGLSLVFAGLGRQDEAAATLERLEATPGIDAIIRLAEVHAFSGHNEEAFRKLETARDEIWREYPSLNTYRWVWNIVNSPFLVPLHDDPRWSRWFIDVQDGPQT